MSKFRDAVDGLVRFYFEWPRRWLFIVSAAILLDLSGIFGYFSYKLLAELYLYSLSLWGGSLSLSLWEASLWEASLSFSLWEALLPFLAILLLLPIFILEFFLGYWIEWRFIEKHHLIKLVYQKILADQTWDYLNWSSRRLSVVGIMRFYKVRQTNIVAILLAAGLSSYSLATTIVVIPGNLFIIYIFSLLLVSALIRRIITDYRIGWGLYGNNEREAREIIDFIMSKSSKIDFFDGGKPKEIISAEDLEEIRQLEPQKSPSEVVWL